MTTAPTSTTYLKGAAFGFAAASIWAGWSAMTRLAVTTNLDALDVAALRFGVAGILLAPVVVQRGLARDRLGWLGLIVMIVGVGAPYVLVAAGGLRFAPASDQGALNPGCMPLFVALIAAITLGERILIAGRIGLTLILAGALVIMGWHAIDRGIAWNASRTFGDALFLCAALMTAGFTVVMRWTRLDPLHAAALVATGSLVIYLPIYLAVAGTRLAAVPLDDLTVQAIFQGVFVTIVSTFSMAVPLSFWVHPAARHSALWCRRFLPCSPSRSSANGRAKPIGSASSSSPLASIWQAEDRYQAKSSLPPSSTPEPNRYRFAAAQSPPSSNSPYNRQFRSWPDPADFGVAASRQLFEVHRP
jgi:drug/metabolite transporter (DMT)-like permease